MESLNIKYNEEAKFLHIEAFGKMLIDDFTKIFRMVSKYSKLIPRLNVLLDLRGTVFRHDPNEVPQLIQPFKEAIKGFKYIKIANIISGEFETALGVLFIIELKEVTNLDTKIFSTLEAATQWVSCGREVSQF